MPPTVVAAAGGDVCAFLATRPGRELLETEITKEFDGWDNMVSSIGWKRISISSVTAEEDRPLAGLDFTAAAELAGVSQAELLCGLVARSQG